VLLHPYLPRLLQACGIDTAGGLIPPGAQDRAAALLVQAVSGSDGAAEFELDVIKLLLGLARETPLPLGGGLLEAHDVLEVDAMLESFVRHWAALKGTSPATAQAHFLQRPGLLRPVDGGYSLRLERTGIDVLLDRLPYACSVVKLPWMRKPIFVEW
jgi:hypothetical protein